MGEPEGLIPRHGEYRKLTSFQVARVVFDASATWSARSTTRVASSSGSAASIAANAGLYGETFVMLWV